MGGWMTYGRMRNRNGIEWRSGTDQLYPGPQNLDNPAVRNGLGALIGDLNRMERDYLEPPDELSRRIADSDPAIECAMATGVDVEVVRQVLAHVFLHSR